VKENKINWPLLILLICIFALLIALSFGKLDVMEELSDRESFEERRLRAEARNRRLKMLIEKKQAVKKKLIRKFKWIYFSLASTFILFIAVIQFILFLVHSNIIIWDTIFTSGFLFLYTIYFRKKFSLIELVKFCEIKIQNKVFGKYVTIDEQIEKHQEEVKDLEQSLSATVTAHPTQLLEIKSKSE